MKHLNGLCIVLHKKTERLIPRHKVSVIFIRAYCIPLKVIHENLPLQLWHGRTPKPRNIYLYSVLTTWLTLQIIRFCFCFVKFCMFPCVYRLLLNKKFNKYWLSEFCLNRLFFGDKKFITAVACIFYATCQPIPHTYIHTYTHTHTYIHKRHIYEI